MTGITDKQTRIYALIQAIIRYLESHRNEVEGVDLTLKKLASMNLTENQLLDVPSQDSRHNAILNDAIDGIKVSPLLNEIYSCLSDAKNDLAWREDNAKYYQEGSDLGEGYKNCNLHTLLIGPDACGFHHDDFNLGVFMLGPRTLYRDHNHDAPELYLNLSEKSGWRFGSDDWQDYPAGSLIWNAAGEPHATKVYDHPFISVFVWLENINSPCSVIHFNDWEEIEKELNHSTSSST